MKLSIQHKEEAVQQWNAVNDTMPSLRNYQRKWDAINVKSLIENDLNFNQIADIARFNALQCNSFTIH